MQTIFWKLSVHRRDKTNIVKYEYLARGEKEITKRVLKTLH